MVLEQKKKWYVHELQDMFTLSTLRVRLFYRPLQIMIHHSTVQNEMYLGRVCKKKGGEAAAGSSSRERESDA